MFIPGKVALALEGKRDAFRDAIDRSGCVQAAYRVALERLSTLTPQEIDRGIGEEPWPGARPIESLQGGLVVPFTTCWESVRDARAWAVRRLAGVPTLAVDGSQIAASKEFGVPVSMVQIAWFENYHDRRRPYVKDVRNEILTAEERMEEAEEYLFAESKLNQRRFSLEMEVAAERMAHLYPNPPPVVFSDGSFVLSFVARMVPRARDTYLHALFGLLDASREHRIPVVGYIDLSFASDLVTLLRTLFPDLPSGNPFDAQILRDRMSPLDRSVAFECARGDILPLYRTATREYSHDLCFVYLKTGANRMPARLDIPRWVVDEGLLDHVIDVVRAEVVAGGGYPYAVETADAAAVLTSEDRMQFYRLFYRFAQEVGLPVSMPAKSVSKAHRR